MATVARERTILVVPTLPETLRRDLRPAGLPSAGVGAALLPLSADTRLLGLLILLGTPTQLARLQQRILNVKLFSIQASLAVWGALQRELSMVDHLTRAYNYAFFTERLTLELQRCHRFELPLSLLLIDIDGFKAINDTAGA